MPTTRSSGQHVRLAQALPLAIGSVGCVQGEVKSVIMVCAGQRRQAARLRSSRLWPVSSSVQAASGLHLRYFSVRFGLYGSTAKGGGYDWCISC